jgi:tellurite resistance protein TerC
VVELSLSVDNLFVFLLIFGYFKVPERYRHKVLFWGIVGALIMRAVFLAAGITLVSKYHWIIYCFGVLLVYSGIKMAMQKDKKVHPERNPVLKLFRRFMHVTPEYQGDRFFVRQNGKLLACAAVRGAADPRKHRSGFCSGFRSRDAVHYA